MSWNSKENFPILIEEKLVKNIERKKVDKRFSCKNIFLWYTLIQFALMMAIMMGNVEDMSSFFNSFIANPNTAFPQTQISRGKFIELKFDIEIKHFFLPQFFLVVFFRYQTIFKFNEWKLIIEKKRWSNEKSVANKSCFNKLFLHLYKRRQLFMLRGLEAAAAASPRFSILIIFHLSVKLWIFHFLCFIDVECIAIEFLSGWKIKGKCSCFLLYDASARTIVTRTKCSRK